MRGMFFIFLLLLARPLVHAQPLNFKWAKQMGGTSSGWGGWGNAVAVDDLGNVYSTGIFTTGTLDADPGPGVSLLSTGAGEAMFISKVDAAGDLVWAKQMSGNEYTLTRGHSITVDADGNVYTTGSFYGGEVDFDPGAGSFILKSLTEDMFISKLDACGNFVWVKQIGGTKEDHVIGYSIALDASGNIYTIGSFDGYAVDLDPGPGRYIFNTDYNVARVFVSKLDAGGKFVWAGQMEAIGDGANFYGSYGLAIATDVAGNIYITGSFAGTVDFDPGPSVSALSTDYRDNYICKLGASGNLIWAHQAGQTSQSFVTGNSMAIDASGNVYTTGFFNGIVDFDPGPGIFNLTGV
ncbi:MAG TPA: SBBP repeat-containing protein, partial [Chitinophagaceae bacterium]|nr:SBBP repeat-containing protein [Chitinophagaceae bacterium]